MAINNLTELVELLKSDPTLQSVSVVRDGTSVTELRLNPIANGIQSTSQTSTVTVNPVTVPTLIDTVTVDNIADNDQGTTNEQLIVDLNGRLTVVEDTYITKPVEKTGLVPEGFYPTYYNPTTGEFIYLS